MRHAGEYSEAKNRLSQLIKSAQAGEEVIIANRGAPAVRLVATELRSAMVCEGSANALRAWLDAHPLPAHRQRSREQIEAAIAEARAAWD